MALSLLAYASKESTKIKDKGVQIRIGEDEKGNPIVIFERDDGQALLFNTLYTKKEVDSLIGSGDTPTYDFNSIIADYLSTSALFAGMKFYFYDWVDEKLETVNKTLSGSDAILKHVIESLNHNIWVMQNQLSFVNRTMVDGLNGLDDRIDDIRQCDCDHSAIYQLQLNDLVDQFNSDIQEISFDRSAAQLLYQKLVSHPSLTAEDTKSTDLVDPSTGKTITFNDFVDLLRSYGVNVNDTTHVYEESKPIYGIVELKSDLQVNGLINGIDLAQITNDAIEFHHQNGYPYYTVTHKDLTQNPGEDGSGKFNILNINIPAELRAMMATVTAALPIFKVNIRNQIIIDWTGKVLNDFIISAENGKYKCPIIWHNQARDCYMLDYKTRDDPEIWFDEMLPFIPLSLFRNGELIFYYLLQQESLESRCPTVKCDIIDARNALRLRESDVHYFYRPNIISYNKDVKYMDNISGENLEWSCECYKMVFQIPDEYDIPIGLEFRFKEHCFGNQWLLSWDGAKWCGENIQGRFNAKIVNKCNIRDPTKDAYGSTGCMVAVKHDSWNARCIPWDKDNGLAYSLFKDCASNGQYETKILFKDGTLAKGADYQLSIGYSMVLHGATYEGYDLVNCSCTYRNYSSSALKVSDIQALYLDLVQPGQELVNRLTFSVGDVHRKGDVYDRGYVDLIGVNDTIERLNWVWCKRSLDIDQTTDTVNPRDVVLYLRKDYTDPLEEVHWDSSTNAFEYIIKQQFYEVSPNPNAATTLYTDFNITSSKIITADNITTMRSDLNLVTNNVDIVSYDVRDIKSRVERLNSDMADQQQKTQYLSHEVDKINVKANVALVMGAVATGLSITSIGLQFKGQIGGFLQRMVSHRGTGMYEQCTGELPLFNIGADPYSLRAAKTTTDLTPVIEWCNKDYTPLKDITFDDDFDNPDMAALTVSGTMDLCNRFRDSLKPAVKLIVDRINEISEDNAALLEDYIGTNDLVRDDIINVIYRVNGHTLLLEAEDTLTKGLLVFSMRLRTEFNGDIAYENNRIYVQIIDGKVTEYKGVENDSTVLDPASNQSIDLKGMDMSEQFRVSHYPNCVLSDKIITIELEREIYLMSLTIEHNSFCRNMSFNIKDLAYTCDIDALNKKIDALADMTNNSITKLDKFDNSIATSYATKDDLSETNSKFSNYMTTADLATNYTQKSEVYTKSESDSMYALKSDIPAIPDNIVSQESLATTLNGYAKTTDIPSIPDNIVSQDDLVNALEPYAGDKYIKYTCEHTVGDTSNGLKNSDEYSFLLTNPPASFSTHLVYQWTNKNGSIGSAIIEVYIVQGSFNRIVQPRVNMGDMEGCKIQSAVLDIFPAETVTYSNNTLTLITEAFTVVGFSVRNGIRYVEDASYIADLVAYRSDIPVVPSNLVNTESLATTLANYPTLDDTNDALDILKNRIDALESENAALKATIESLRPSYPWQTFYEGFDERVEYIDTFTQLGAFCYAYSESELKFRYNPTKFTDGYEYLFLLSDYLTGRLHYIRFIPSSKEGYLDEIYGDTEPVTGTAGACSFTLENLKVDAARTRIPFDYVFRKPI